MVDLAVAGTEPLGMVRRLAPRPLPFSSSRRLGRDLRPVAVAAPAVRDAGHDRPLGGSSPFGSFWRKRLAALARRRLRTRRSSTMPGWSTARRRGRRLPRMRMSTSSRCHLSPGRGRRRLRALANDRPKRGPQARRLSWLTTMPRRARLSATSRRLRPKQWSSQTAWLMGSAGQRKPWQALGPVLLLGNPPHRRDHGQSDSAR